MTGREGRTGTGRVFISYAHDDPAHIAAVRGFAEFLTAAGVPATLDFGAAAEPRDWSMWTRAQIHQAAAVLVIASPKYAAVADDRLSETEHRGARWESRLLRELFYVDGAAARRRVLGVILPGGSPDDLPFWLSPHIATRYRVTARTEDGAAELLAVLRTRLGDPDGVGRATESIDPAEPTGATGTTAAGGSTVLTGRSGLRRRALLRAGAAIAGSAALTGAGLSVSALLRDHGGPPGATGTSPPSPTTASSPGPGDAVAAAAPSTPVRPVDVAVLTGHRGPVNCVAFDADGRWLASGGDDGTVRLWDIGADPPRPTGPPLPGGVGPVASIAFGRFPGLPSRGFLASCGPGGVRLMPETGAADQPFGGRIDLPAGPGRPPVALCAPGPGGSALLGAGGATVLLAATGDHGLLRWNVPAAPRRPSPAFPVDSVDQQISTLCADADGTRLAGLGTDRVLLWDLTATTPAGPSPPSGVAVVNPAGAALRTDGVVLAVVDVTWQVHLREVARLADPDREVSVPVPIKDLVAVNAVAYGRDGGWLAVAGGAGELWVCHLPGTDQAPAQPTRLAGHRGDVRAVAAGPRPGVLASGGADGDVRLWTLR